MAGLLFNTEMGRHRGTEGVLTLWRGGGCSRSLLKLRLVFRGVAFCGGSASSGYRFGRCGGSASSGYGVGGGGYRKVNVPVNLAPEERSFLFSAKPCGLLVDREVDLPG